MFLFYLSFTTVAYPQSKTNLTIESDSSVVGNVLIDFQDGINQHFLTDSLFYKKSFVLPLSGPYGLLSIQSPPDNYISYLVNEKPGSLKVVSDGKAGFKIIDQRNIVNPFDTIENKIFKEFLSAAKPINIKLNRFYQDNSLDKVKTTDSLKSIQINLIKSIDSIKMVVFKMYPNEYFSYFMSKNLLEYAVNTSDNFDYLTLLRSFFVETFPDKFVKNIEAVHLLEKIDIKLGFLNNENDISKYLFTDDNNNHFKIGEINSDYILMDFWATWCPTCMKQLPIIDSISKNYHPSKLQIIGVNVIGNI
ncbi:TlpA family protein disulfide reductase [Sphingobacterium hungaricum]